MTPNAAKIVNYFKQGGNVICPVSGEGLNCLNAVRGICCQSQNDHQRFWIRQTSSWISNNPSCASFLSPDQLKTSFPNLQFSSTTCDNNSQQQQQQQLSEATLLVSGFKNEAFFKALDKVKQTKILLDFKPVQEAKATESYLPIFSSSTHSSSLFDWNKYKDQLKTKSLGRSVIHSKVVSSTFDLLDGPESLQHGLAVIADRQIKGRGRGQNVWLSPEGCAMTSFQLKASLKTIQGQKASLLQHLTSLAVVHSIMDKLDNQVDLDLRLKWPNDIYWESKVKLGGVVAFSSIFQDQMTFNVGLGFNLSNDKPTMCLNGLLAEHGQSLMSRETFFAQVFNVLEGFLQDLERPNGLEDILGLYHKYWLHQDQKVTLVNADDDGNAIEGVVQRIDQDGYLVVQLEHDGGQEVTVQPGSNSFDMMQGLILPKKSTT
jgi:biotin-[acetyl-CoA-carboxylase] ligase BirA-like protein